MTITLKGNELASNAVVNISFTLYVPTIVKAVSGGAASTRVLVIFN